MLEPIQTSKMVKNLVIFHFLNFLNFSNLSKSWTILKQQQSLITPYHPHSTHNNSSRPILFSNPNQRHRCWNRSTIRYAYWISEIDQLHFWNQIFQGLKSFWIGRKIFPELVGLLWLFGVFGSGYRRRSGVDVIGWIIQSGWWIAVFSP